MRPKLAIVTATTDLDRAWDCVKTWDAELADLFIVVISGGGQRACYRPTPNVVRYHIPEVCGTVKPFLIGCEIAEELGAYTTLCLHDDVEILDRRWRSAITGPLGYQGLFGFGGATGLASDNVHDGRLEADGCAPEEIVQRLARWDFISNMRDAEKHGRRVSMGQQVACLQLFGLCRLQPLL